LPAGGGYVAVRCRLFLPTTSANTTILANHDLLATVLTEKSNVKFVTRLLLFFLAATLGIVRPAEIRAAELKPMGADLAYADEIRTIVEGGIEAGEMPGALVVVAGPTSVRYAMAFGNRQLEPEVEPMTLDTLFDLASLTKPIATATSVMTLVQAGKIDLQAPVSRYLPEFGGQGKESIRVTDLLLHVGGLIPDNALRDYDDGSERAWQRICDLKPISPPGNKFAYTDVGFIVLGKLVEKLGGKSLDAYSRDSIFRPLGMEETTFNPDDSLRSLAAPTEKRNGNWMQGEVHDPRAYRLGGVAGHAGLFSTAGDLVKYGQMMLAGGHKDDVVVLDAGTLSQMTRPRTIPRGTRTYGWDHRTGYSRNRGESLSEAAFGHGGFTGTVMWIDPEKEIVFIFLSNRLHPDGKGTVNGLAGQIATVVGNAEQYLGN
jgi:CubicO group peptidase (beta-lactamase class C family)